MSNEYYMKSPVGHLKITEHDGFIVGLDYVDGESISENGSTNSIIDQCIAELGEYFKGRRSRFDVPVDLSYRGTPFQQKVWNRLYEIPFGETISYKTLAMDCGGPNHSRAVANANGKNPISIIVPCHRVIAHDGTLGGYTGGLDKKETLLGIEGR
ncbi:methylated-DNA--[protein]-cysteine S-methyltransferase [Salinicoccus halodurans]|nr:methylated-DNA--[protein]-cysteine S-methyltransferase [Salinicoccus halodurans]SFK94455.1 methylated-DNA-[protein]-cysteine S-methyltransferase [Salinicoccus halodurans]